MAELSTLGFSSSHSMLHTTKKLVRACDDEIVRVKQSLPTNSIFTNQFFCFDYGRQDLTAGKNIAAEAHRCTHYFVATLRRRLKPVYVDAIIVFN